jgi:hypothetical protein
MNASDFSTLARTQPWGAVDLQYDGWYQYAVCEKAPASLPGLAHLPGPAQEEQAADWSTV